MGSPESVVNRVLRSGAALDLALRSDMRKPVPERIEEWPGKRMASQDYNWRERRKELTAKTTKTPATATAIAISQKATSRVHARNAELSQPSARTANIAPTTS